MANIKKFRDNEKKHRLIEKNIGFFFGDRYRGRHHRHCQSKARDR
jgi:hypothetical protein